MANSRKRSREVSQYRQMGPEERRRASLQREKKKVKREIYFTGFLISAVILSMTFYMCVYSAAQEQELFGNDYNGREEILLSKNTRGTIYAGDGTTALAWTDPADENTRIYPYGSLFSHVVGYDYKGGSGIEQKYNYELVHSDITLAEQAALDAKQEKYPSDNVYTTLDINLQQAASEAMGNYRGAIIVSEVKTGKILCMVSKPDFDPNKIAENWDTLLADGSTGTLVNRVSQGLFPPGSTFKIFDAVDFMQENLQASEDYTFDCPGYVTIDGETITCYHWEVHGHLDLITSFAHSCNSSFANIGAMLDRTTFRNTLSTMMFGEKLPYEMDSAISSYVLDDDTSTKEAMQLAIGQGHTLMSPLHLNMITAAIANGGTVYVPYVVDHVTSGYGKVLKQNDPTKYRQVMSSEIASRMRVMMKQVVEVGTASKLRTRSYQAAGKTGSAEFVDGTRDSHAWFTGFAPYDNPEVAITVILEGAGSGGSYAVPLARHVLDAYFGVTGDNSDLDDSYWTSPDGGNSSVTTAAQPTQQPAQTQQPAAATQQPAQTTQQPAQTTQQPAAQTQTAAAAQTTEQAAQPAAAATTTETPAATADTGEQQAAAAAPAASPVNDLGVEETPRNTMKLNLDYNKDGVQDSIDLDGDGIPEIVDTDGDGIPDTQVSNGEVPYITWKGTGPEPARIETPQAAAATTATAETATAAETPAATEPTDASVTDEQTREIEAIESENMPSLWEPIGGNTGNTGTAENDANGNGVPDDLENPAGN